MMGELHWTGAALLLAVGLPGSESMRARRAGILICTDRAPQHGFEDEYHPTASELAGKLADVHGTPANTRPDRELPDGTVQTAQPGAVQGRAGTNVVANPEAEWGEQSPPSALYRAEATCSHCGWIAGDVEWDAAAPGRGIRLRPVAGGAPQPLARGVRLRCDRCGGSVFAEHPERVRPPPIVNATRTARGRPRKSTTLRAS